MNAGNGALALAASVELASQLTAAGLPAAVDPAEVPVPGAWVAVDRLGGTETLAGYGTAQLVVWVVVPTGSYVEVLTDLTTRVDLALTVATNSGDVEFGQALSVPAARDGAPACKYPVHVQL